MIHKWLIAHQQYCDKELHWTCECGMLRWMKNREKTVEKKFVELSKQNPWIDVDLVVACYQYNFKEIVRARESSEFSLTNVVTVLDSTRIIREKCINMQLLLENCDCYYKESVFCRAIRFDLQKYETRFSYKGVLGQIDITWLSETI